MKKSRIIAPALGVLILSTAASITGTVAWFTANNSVTISGMQVKTKVSNNLLIVADELASSSKKEESLFESGPFTQTVRGILEPVSTVDGKNFYYTTNAKADGDAKVDTYTKYGTEAALEGDDATNYLDGFSKAYGLTKTEAATLSPDPDGEGALTAEQGAKAYVDYVFQLRAQNVGAAAEDLKVTALNLTYGAATDASKAWRAAVFAEDITSAAAAGATTLKAILRPNGSRNFSELEQTPTVKAVDSTTTLGNVTYSKPAVADPQTAAVNPAVLASVPNSGIAQYYKVTVRLWLEGEDTSCNNSTFASLTNSWSLDLTVELGGTNDAVTQLGMAVTNA